MVFVHFVVMPIVSSPTFLWVTSSSLSSICFRLCNHGRAHGAYGELFGEANAVHGTIYFKANRHHRRQGGRTGSSVVPLWHQQRAYAFGSVGRSRSHPGKPCTMYRACNATREGGCQWHVASGWEAAIFFVADVCLGAIGLVACTDY